ncbi:MAG: DUF2203 domain-containing protein [Planctomycetes bacterium]|nr:DUF2203 domain-containing protein [Planctomycetota bacterium]
MPGSQAEVRLFTLDEARKTLPLVRSIVGDILECYRSLFEKSQAYLQIKGESGKPTKHGLARAKVLEDEMSTLKQRLDSAAFELAELGIELKDYEMGLVDFRSIREGEEVSLCWKFGEDTIGFWHPLDTGYKGRRPLGSEK